MKQAILAAAILSISLTACSGLKVGRNKPTTNYTPAQVVDNQFVFSGDPEVVQAYLKDNDVSASLEKLDKDEPFYLVRYEGKHDLNQIVADLKPVTEFVEPNFRVTPVYKLRKAEWPTDRLFFKQWALNNIGQAAPFGLPGTRGADMDILKTWEQVTKGSDKIVVAVIDTGCDYTHPDLKANIWVNEKESEAKGGIAGRDDDGNGYIDDMYGYDFTSADRTSFKGVPGDPDPMDDSGHGTHCAGSIGASTNDGVGIAGLAQKVKLMCVKFLGDSGGTSVDAYRAVRYARENGAHIMSNSWGGTADNSELFKAELRRAEQKGILFIAAAGNNGTNNDIKPHFPSNHRGQEFRGKKFSNVLSVAASDNQDAPADFTNYGHETVDIFAPGVAIMSTYPQALTPPGRPAYATMSGTSMATPYVAGVAALILSANPGLIGNPAEVIRLINETADVKPQLVGKAVSNGRINAFKAVTAQITGPKMTPVWQTKSHAINQRGFNTELVDIRHEIKIPGAKSIKVHFDFIQIEEPYDSLYIYDKDFRLISVVEKNMVDDFWSPAIPGDTVHVRFVNSLLQQVKQMPLRMSSESACVARGATSVVRVQNEYQCDVDSDESESSGGSKKYTSFNSEGFSIDRVAYVMADPSETGKE